MFGKAKKVAAAGVVLATTAVIGSAVLDDNADSVNRDIDAVSRTANNVIDELGVTSRNAIDESGDTSGRLADRVGGGVSRIPLPVPGGDGSSSVAGGAPAAQPPVAAPED